RRGASGWSAQIGALGIGDTQSGATLAWDPVEGFGVASYDLSSSAQMLFYAHMAPAGAGFGTADHVVGFGSSGWWPSLAMDRDHHEPLIAYYTCSLTGGATQGSCKAEVDELRITQRILGNW